MIKVGIVCDNYKLSKFQMELDKYKFYYNVFDYNIKSKLSLIKVTCTPDRIGQIKSICELLEINFNQAN